MAKQDQKAREANKTASEVRSLAEYLASDDHLEALADMATERATRNFLSYDPEALAEIIRDDFSRDA